MTTKAIKDVPDDVWRAFKSQADMEGKKLAEYLEELVKNAQEERRNVKKIWQDILSSKSDHPELYGKSFERRIKEFRSGFDMREFK